MTILQKAIFAEIKAHNADRAEDLGRFNTGIKFESMTRYNKPGYQDFVVCYSGETLTRYEVKCRFKAPKYENNIVKYMVNVYSDGTTGIYFDGTEYERK